MYGAVSRSQLRNRFGFGRSKELMVPGDFEDPRQLGILRKSSCYMYRQRLQSIQQANLLQGLMILTGMIMVITVLWFQTVKRSSSFAPDRDPATEQGERASMAGTLNALWLGVSNILGLRTVGGRMRGAPSPRSYYCNQELDTKRIFRQIGKQVLNQEHALARLERAVKNDRQMRSVALVGPPGVGKTLTTLVLRHHFPWPENVHSFSWSTHVPDNIHKLNVLNNFVEQLSSCGQNLLIIDNLTSCDYKFVSTYNKMLMKRKGDAALAANQRVLVIYIFSLDTECYWQQFEQLQQLPMDTTIINYRLFGRAELMSCLENELRLEQHTLDMRTLSIILEEAMLDVEEVGCKRIRQLLIRHGLPDPE